MLPVAAAVYAFCNAIDPPKMKYGVCAIPEERLFFLFNSRALHGPTKIAMIEVTPVAAPFLKHDSFLDTGILLPMSPEHIQEAMTRNKVWDIAPELRSAIKHKVQFHGLLPGRYERLVLGSF